FQRNGGYELFSKEDKPLFEDCKSNITNINRLLLPIFGEDVFESCSNKFKFGNIQKELIFNRFEGQINTGKMMAALLEKVQSSGIKILNNVSVQDFEDMGKSVQVTTDKFTFKTGKFLIATNGFASQLGIAEVKPARAQVLITKPIENLQIKGTFHLDKGYYYFRNIDSRILFGGGRNLDLKGEETTDIRETALIQNKLEELLKTVILPKTPFEIDQRWSGIMGVGKTKKPVIKAISENVYCGVRLGGMGVAIGSLIGRDLANLARE
ncbi:MAG: FAD-dependent oxidoreductase, partial [Gillisia sp.]